MPVKFDIDSRFSLFEVIEQLKKMCQVIVLTTMGVQHARHK